MSTSLYNTREREHVSENKGLHIDSFCGATKLVESGISQSTVCIQLTIDDNSGFHFVCLTKEQALRMCSEIQEHYAYLDGIKRVTDECKKTNQKTRS